MIEACSSPPSPATPRHPPVAQDHGLPRLRRFAVLDLGLDRLRLLPRQLILEHGPVVRVVHMAGGVDVDGAEAPRLPRRPVRRLGMPQPHVGVPPRGALCVHRDEVRWESHRPQPVRVEADPQRHPPPPAPTRQPRPSSAARRSIARSRCRTCAPPGRRRSAGSAPPGSASGAPPTRPAPRTLRRPGRGRRRPGASARSRRGAPARSRSCPRSRVASRARTPAPPPARAPAR
jgi:hypothetical protein